MAVHRKTGTVLLFFFFLMFRKYFKYANAVFQYYSTSQEI